MTTNHTYFEVMCSLAASGQLTKTEQVELREHSEHCVLCRNRLVEMRQSGFQLFLARAFKTPSKRLPKGMQERFAARAISEGIPLSSRSAGTGFNALGMVTVLLLVLLLVAALSRIVQSPDLLSQRMWPSIRKRSLRKAFRTMRFRGKFEPAVFSIGRVNFLRHRFPAQPGPDGHPRSIRWPSKAASLPSLCEILECAMPVSRQP